MHVIAADIETGSVKEMHTYGPGYIRLVGWSEVADDSEVHISTDPMDLVTAMRAADAITGHNFINFDLMAFAVQGYVSRDEYEVLARKTFDSQIVARHLDPVPARDIYPNGHYNLGRVAARFGLDGKDTTDFEGKREIARRVRGDKYANRMKPGKENEFSVLKLLAGFYGGFDKIPQDDPDYVRYLIKDVVAQRGVYRALSAELAGHSAESRRYVRREHYTATTMGRVTLEGARVDTDWTMTKVAEGQARLSAHVQMMHVKYGMPLEGKKPHTTNLGKAALRSALLGTGISERALAANWPVNGDKSLSTAKDVLTGFLPLFEASNPDAAEIVRTVLAMNGERTVYGTVADHTVNGRVHPYISPDQGTGRWSMKDPGLTVLGKRGGKARERAMILADSADEVLVAIDADQVDARVIAAECQDPEYMSLFEPGMDLHSEVAFRIWSSPADHGPDCKTDSPYKCRCDKRDKAKVFGHGFSYGLGANSMAIQHGVPREVADRFVIGMTQAFPRLAEWKAEIRASAGAMPYGERAPLHDNHRILYTWAGRPVRVERDRAYTQATALIGQGGTRDVMAEAALRLEPKWRRRIRAIIHDEFLITLPKEGAEQTAQDIADRMAFTLRGVDITFGISDLGDCWAACYGADYCPHGALTA